ncbi:hypothetical protein RR48_09226 [Papilio machaon]|uniref:Uncharacterized protein n=1 Tax=Papilio machaon TaxID=76193 RepID=A0A194RCK1_PAPMA|nr:hypothetical protein RR48_09226 [Papilio machaon]
MKTRELRPTKLSQKGTRSPKLEKRGAKQEARRSKNTSTQSATPGIPRERAKRSGIEAVKLHLQATGGTGRTSRSATSVKYLNMP